MPEHRRRVFAALAIATVAAAGVLSYFASSSPDALEHSVERFAPAAWATDATEREAAGTDAYEGALPDYSVPGLGDKPFLSGGIAGLAGAGATFVVIAGVGLALKARRRARREG